MNECQVCDKQLFKKPKDFTAIQYHCARCSKSLCGLHCYSYVDESNSAITKSSPNLCKECYEEQHGIIRRYSPNYLKGETI